MSIRQTWISFLKSINFLEKSSEQEVKNINYHQVIEKEKEILKKRRKELGVEEADQLDNNKFGIALSGGGIRSATINLGFLQTLNDLDVLKRADYLSTVSGGGYTGAYIQATLKKEKGNYDQLFKDAHIDHMRKNGEYLMPGRGIEKFLNRIILVVGFFISLLMSWLSPFIIFMLCYLGYLLLEGFGLNQAGYSNAMEFLFNVIMPLGMVLLFLHFILNVVLNYSLSISKFFNKLEAILFIVVLLGFAGSFIFNLDWSRLELTSDKLSYYIMVAFALVVLGYFANPNSLSFHRFYRNQLANAFLNNAAEYKNVLLQDLLEKNKDSGKNDIAFTFAPYPIFNTCLNLQAVDKPKTKKGATRRSSAIEDQIINFAGTKTSDYFLLSPLYCGSKLTGYIPTSDTYNYKDITLPAAATISAAAVNPGMGSYSNRILSILTTILNARLGYWILNPKKTKLYDSLVWWPRYFVYELLSKIGIDNEMLNISDGGHIENLGIYELLRRKCRLIIAVDAGADPEFIFDELENLTIRARNELGLEIRFRRKNILEEKIRPKPSVGYSEDRFAVADICQVWEEIKLKNEFGEALCDLNGKDLEILINYKGYEKVVSKDFVLRSILKKVKKQITPKVAPFILMQAMDILEKKVKEKLEDDLKIGTFVYVKSSITAPQGKPYISKEEDPVKYYTYKYKIYHPEFPHESTADQFFDPIQWTAYYELGRYICADVMGVDNLDEYLAEVSEMPKGFGIDKLIEDRFKKRIKIYMAYKSDYDEKKKEALREKRDPELDFAFQPMAIEEAPKGEGNTMREIEERILEEGKPLPQIMPDSVKSQTVSDSTQSKIVIGKDVDYEM